jgi:nitrous oxidase accessory protein NosD
VVRRVRRTAVSAFAAFLLAASPAIAATIQVSPGGTDVAACGTGGLNPACATIQGALDTSPAAGGDTIQVAAGTYTETATLTVDQSVTIAGAGSGSTRLTVPPGSNTGLAQDAAGNYALVFIGAAASGTTIEDLTVDGNGDANAGQNTPVAGGNHPFVGIDIKDAVATVQRVRITNVEDTPLGGSPHGGTALSDLNDDGTARTLTVDTATIDNYEKAGMVFDGNGMSGLTANVTNSTVTGVGPTPTLAQNGIEYLDGAAGTVSGNTVSGDECNVSGACGPNQFTASQGIGILLYNTGPMTVSGNTVTGTDDGIFYGYPDSGTATISGNVLSGNRFEGVLLNQGTANVSGNVISGSNIGVQAASYDQVGDPPDTGNVIANLTDNTISGNVTGISLDDDNPTPTFFPVLTASNNVISQNSTSGVANNVPEPQNATSNYWGCSAGPGNTGCDGPTGSGAGQVSVSPFLALAPPFPPAIQVAFGAASITTGGSTSLTFTITNPNPGTQLTGIGVSDTLPSGLSVSTPNGLTGSCGGGTIMAIAGSSSVVLSGATLAASAQCTFAVNVTAASSGAKTDTTGAITSDQGGSGGTATASLAVLPLPPVAVLPLPPAIAPPTVSIVSPPSGATYTFGQVVQANYGCQEAAGGPGIQSCSGPVANGSRVNTSRSGKLSFTVTATSKDGQTASQTVHYTVLPNNLFQILNLKLHASDGSVTFNLKLPGSGAVDVLETAWKSTEGKAGNARATAGVAALLQPLPGRFALARLHLNAHAGGTIRVVVKPNARGTRLVKHHRGKVFIRLWVTYTPTGGFAKTIGRLGLLLIP